MSENKKHSGSYYRKRKLQQSAELEKQAKAFKLSFIHVNNNDLSTSTVHSNHDTNAKSFVAPEVKYHELYFCHNITLIILTSYYKIRNSIVLIFNKTIVILCVRPKLINV